MTKIIGLAKGSPWRKVVRKPPTEMLLGYTNGGWEYPLYLTLLALVQFLLGDGAFALVRSTSPDAVLGGAAASPRATRSSPSA